MQPAFLFCCRGGTSQQPEGACGMQAHAWAALGKLGLADEPLARKCIHLFVQQLEHATSPAVRGC